MRSHGWSGRPPASDTEAVHRILAAARVCIDRAGAGAGISDVARELGVTRQTVYRYFPSAGHLFAAAATDAAGGFLDRIERYLAEHPGAPAEVAVEGVAYLIEQMPAEPYVGLLLSAGRCTFAQGLTAPAALTLGRDFIRRFPVDWARAGFSPEDLDELVEQLLRTAQSFVLDPGAPPRTGAELRRYLTRWLAPSIAAQASAPGGAVRAGRGQG
ncbi:TetR/AcrR family transcriptional regulator [Frankia sp. AgB32]|uniref:TetR/AcrR family transcriptional regulator n=1 Tax=Frankia sp. AgB32 TaxID=631119 RepID=UPI00200EFEF1|nr:TetR family transcriptional regulator [Frankia sp. AgB32]MCK9895402.1 TetR family transcriptional regulator [Frankia sp. AgB32]